MVVPLIGGGLGYKLGVKIREYFENKQEVKNAKEEKKEST